MKRLLPRHFGLKFQRVPAKNHGWYGSSTSGAPSVYADLSLVSHCPLSVLHKIGKCVQNFSDSRIYVLLWSYLLLKHHISTIGNCNNVCVFHRICGCVGSKWRLSMSRKLRPLTATVLCKTPHVKWDYFIAFRTFYSLMIACVRKDDYYLTEKNFFLKIASVSFRLIHPCSKSYCKE